jgi:hypothetical protein
MRLLAIVLLVLAVSASAASAALSPAEYRQQSNALCASVGKQVKALPDPRSARTAAAYFDKIVAISSSALTRFKGFDPPAQWASIHRQLIANNAGQIAVFREAGRLIRGGATPQAAIAKVEPRVDRLLAADEHKLWTRVGARTCSG